MSPKVSVIVPTYNRAHVVEDTLNSIIYQTFKDYELIIVDGDSVDNTDEVIDKFIKEHSDIKIKYIKQKNKGVYSGINEGIEHAVGEYLGILDSDDFWINVFLDVMVSELDKNKTLGMVYCGQYSYNDENGTLIPEDLSRAIEGDVLKSMVFCEKHIGYYSALFRRSSLNEVGNFDGYFRTLGDREFHYRFSKRYRYKLVKAHMVIHSEHTPKNPLVPLGGSHHINFEEQISKYEKYMLLKLLNDKDLYDRFFLFKRRIVSSFNYRWGLHYFVRGEIVLAKKYFLKSILINPLNFYSLAHYIACQLNIFNTRERDRINKIEANITGTKNE